MNEWNGFKGNLWKEQINVQDFINENYKEYKGDESFLTAATDKTQSVWSECERLLKLELENGVLDVETEIVSGINNYKPGYICKDDNIIVGLQTDAPLKRIVNPFGGMRMVNSSLEAYGYKLGDTIKENFSKYRKTHNDGVFDAYTTDIKKARHVGLLTGLPDAYGRGRIIAITF